MSLDPKALDAAMAEVPETSLFYAEQAVRAYLAAADLIPREDAVRVLRRLRDGLYEPPADEPYHVHLIYGREALALGRAIDAIRQLGKDRP